MDYLTRHVSTPVPQTEQESPLQVANSAGGFSFAVDPWKRLERFLILGSEGGTYYIGEKDLTKENIDNIKALIELDGFKVLVMTTDISVNGRSYKNDAAIFVLALAMTLGSDKVKEFARERVNEIVRTSTHLFVFESFLKAIAPGTGLGTSRNRAIAAWYENKTTEQIAYQAVKYRQREGWTHRDSLRQARPKGIDPVLAHWILGKDADEGTTPQLPEIVTAFEVIQKSKNKSEVLEALVTWPNLPWETIPTQFLKDADIWKMLFYNGQIKGQALVRNITRLARLDAFMDLDFAYHYTKMLIDPEMIEKTRLHPINYLNALNVHTNGQREHQGYGRKMDWKPSQLIIDALNKGFHASFKSVVPTGKRTLLSVDVSGSMASAMALGLDLTAAQVAGAMAVTIAKTEEKYQIMGFASRYRELGITAESSLHDAMNKVQDRNFGTTDCSLPIEWALENRYNYDTFVVITDNETYMGRRHPHITLQEYRRKTGIDARLIVVATSSNNFTIADPNDAGMLDVAGADSNLPKLIAEFSKGNL